MCLQAFFKKSNGSEGKKIAAKAVWGPVRTRQKEDPQETQLFSAVRSKLRFNVHSADGAFLAGR